MIKAFIFGKFMPFHKGHEAMIRFALTKCDFLSVLVCCSDKENIDGSIRTSWIENTFNQKNVEVKFFDYLESEFPNSSESSREISKIWATYFKKQFPDYSLVVTSEPYGDYVAEFMGIEHIPFDMERVAHPISATAIRNNLFENWNFLPNSVKPYYAIKVVILGTESTGKTVLAKNLAKHYNSNLVLEAGRDLIPSSNSFSFDDLQNVARVHAKRIEDAIVGDSPLTIIDTDIHITKSYSKFTFSKDLGESPHIYNSNKSHLYLYLNNDVEHIQDGTRFNEERRNELDLSHRQVLRENHIYFNEINGSWDERFKKAITHINRLMHSINDTKRNQKVPEYTPR